MSIKPQNAPMQPVHPAQTHSSQRRQCDQLGLCQSLTPACTGCGHHDTEKLSKGSYLFAPGVIEGGPSAKPRVGRTGWLTVLRVLAWAVLMFVLAGLAGYAAGHTAVWLEALR